VTINILQSPTQTTTTTGTTASCSFASLPATGNAVIVVLKTNSSGGAPHPTSIADNQSGNTYVNIQTQDGGGYPGATAIWWCPAIAAPSGTFTVTGTFGTVTASTEMLVELYEVSGLAGTVDQSISTNDGGTGVKTATSTNSSANTNANDLVMCAIVTGNNGVTGSLSTPTTGYTVLNATDGTSTFGECANTAYKIVSAIETSSATWSWAAIGSNSFYNAVLATFKAAGTANVASIAWVT
jgi:hypothetical protein